MNTLSPNQHATLKILMTDTSSAQPIAGLVLAKRIGLKARAAGIDGGDMRSIIHTLRVKGFPICAGGRGYYYAREEGELSKFIDRLQNRIISLEEALKGLKFSVHNVGIKATDPIPQVRYRTRVPLLNSKGNVVYADMPLGDNGAIAVPPGYKLI